MLERAARQLLHKEEKNGGGEGGGGEKPRPRAPNNRTSYACALAPGCRLQGCEAPAV